MGWPDGYDRIELGSVDSTNAHGLRLAAELAGPTWVVAQRQSAGRGRRGRGWAMPEGNLAATLVMRPKGPPAEMALRSFVAALALDDALCAVTGRADPFALKWPNDVLLNGGKLAGILLESAAGALAIGIGVNLAAAPDPATLEEGALRPVSLAGETGLAPTPVDFLNHLASAYARREDQFRSLGFAPIREAWLARAARLGEMVTARTGQTETTGRFETVDAEGHLVLSTSTSRVAIPAADIFF